MKERSEQDHRSFRDHRDCGTLTKALFEQWPGAEAPGRVHHYRKGTFLWDEAVAHHSLYVLRRGQVAILLNDAAGCELIVRLLNPGEAFGELCFCSARNQPRENCARAVVDSSVLEIDFSEFEVFLSRNPKALERFAFTLCERLSDAEGRIEVLSHAAADVRLGRLLMQLAAKRGVATASDAGRVRVAIGHEELAQMAAMSRPHVTVTMGKLRARRVVEYSRGTQLTIDLQGLSAYLDHTPAQRDGAKGHRRKGVSNSAVRKKRT